MATYKDIQSYIKLNYDCTVKTCWIAHMKSICGLPVGRPIIEKTLKKEFFCVRILKKIL